MSVSKEHLLGIIISVFIILIVANKYTKKCNIYLDNNATTHIYPEVAKKMYQMELTSFGNPSSPYELGRESKSLMDESRTTITKLLDIPNKEGIVFTSGASEANNLILRGLLNKCKEKGKNHIITTNIEHPSVINTVKDITKSDYNSELTILQVDSQGFINLEELRSKLKNPTCMVSIIHGNNEIGTIQNIKEIVNICKEKKVHLHLDMTQIVGRYYVSIKSLGVNSFSMSSHKFHGPKGVGLLWIDDKEKIKPIITGGEQEDHFRAGTENIIGIYGMSLALQKSLTLIKNGKDREVAELTKYLRTQIRKELGDMVKFNGPEEDERRLYNTINLCLVDMNSRMLLRKLDKKGIYINVASACQKTAKSHVMEAIGISDKLSQGSVRISLGLQNTKKDVEVFLKEFVKLVKEKKFQKKYVLN